MQPPPRKPTGAPVKPPSRPAMPSVGVRRAVAAVSLPTIGAGAVAAEIASEISSLQSEVASLQSRVSLSDVQSEVARLDQQFGAMTQTLESVRRQGYVYGGDMDTKLYDLMSQWQSVKPQLDDSIYQQAYALSQSAYALHGPLAQLAANTNNASFARSLLPSVRSSVDALSSNAFQAENNLRSMYSGIASQTSEIAGRLDQVEAMMQHLAAAKFRLAGGEGAVMSVKAKLDKDGKDDPEGNLFLTDRRLIFEQKQEVATKKVLFIATEKELVQEVLLDKPLSELTSIKASKKGLMGHEDHLDVQFGGQSFHFHIDGQDCKEWQALVERAKAGGLEGERAASVGVSIADMTGPVTQADIMQLQADFNDLQDRALLGFAKDALEDMDTKVNNLPRQLNDARARGYVFEKTLETKVQSLAGQWVDLKRMLTDDLGRQTTQLAQLVTALGQQVAQVVGQSANPQAARPLYLQARSQLAGLQTQTAAAEMAILGQYDDFQIVVDSASAQLDWAAWMLEALATASFQLMATEGGVAAAEANWLRPNMEPMGGILFLTDQRLIFEEREGEFSVPLEAPASAVESVKALSGQGANQDQEHLSLTFGAGAPASSALFQLVGPAAADWQAMIGRAKSGDYASDRAVEIDQAALERLKNAPTKCPNCGSAFTKPAVRGQTSIKCEFCGTITNF